MVLFTAKNKVLILESIFVKIICVLFQSITTLQSVPKEEFSFLEGMDSLISLELGDCKTWGKQVCFVVKIGLAVL